MVLRRASYAYLRGDSMSFTCESENWDDSGMSKEEYLDLYTADCYQCSEELDKEAVLCGSDICEKCWKENGN